MFDVEIDIELSTPVEEVFAYLADVTRQPEWEPHIRECTPDGELPLHVGSTATQRIEVMGEVRDVTLTVIELTPGACIRFEKSVPIPITFGWDLTPSSGGTHVRYRVTLGVTGTKRLGFLVMRALIPLGVKTPLHADLERIRRATEKVG